MFYKTDLLVRSGGEFTLIWLLAHNKTKATPATISELNIKEKCEALLKYLPTGQLSASEIRNKMSLYLLAILQYGIVVAFNRKTEIVYKKLDDAIRQFFKQQLPKPEKKRKTATDEDGSKTKKSRRTTTAADGMEPIPVIEEEQLIDLRNLPTESISNRARVTDLRQITLAEYDEQPQGFFNPDIRDFEAMMQMELDMQSEQSREAVDQIREEVDQFFQNHDLEAMIQTELDRRSEQSRVAQADQVFQEQMQIDEAQPFHDQEQMQVGENVIPDRTAELESELVALDPKLQLPVLNETELMSDILAQQQENQEEVRPRQQRQRRNLNVDKKIELSDNDIRRNLDNYSDICVDRRIPAFSKKLPTVLQLMAPFPYYLTAGKEQFGQLFEGAVKEAKENLKRQAENIEQKLPERDVVEPITLESRRSTVPNFDVSAAIPLAGEEQFEPMFEVAEENLERQEQNPEQKLPEPDVVQPINMVSQPSTLPTLDSSTIPFDPTLEATQFPAMDHTAINQDVDMQEPVFIPAADNALLERIKEAKGERNQVEFLEFANKTSRTAVARDFVNLLHLLKHRSVKVAQTVSYGPIVVETVDNQ